MFGRAYLPRLFVEGVSRSAARCGITPHLRLGSWLAQRQTQALELVPLAALLEQKSHTNGGVECGWVVFVVVCVCLCVC